MSTRDASRIPPPVRLAGWIAVALAGAAVVVAAHRLVRVHHGRMEVPVYPEAREGPQHARYWPRLLAWDDRSSARVDRIFAIPARTSLLDVARYADASLASRGWYLVTPSDLVATRDPQVIVWQRDPDERLDLSMLWPIEGMTPTQRLYGGRFPTSFLDEPAVIGWTWSLGGPRSAHPLPSAFRSIVRKPPSPDPPGIQPDASRD